jgi:hypothetical protein
MGVVCTSVARRSAVTTTVSTWSAEPRGGGGVAVCAPAAPAPSAKHVARVSGEIDVLSERDKRPERISAP